MSLRPFAIFAGASFFAATPALSQTDDLDFTIINRSSVVIQEFFARSFEDMEWTRDLLFNDSILPGESATFNVTDGAWLCEFEIAFWFSDGSNLFDAVDICDRADYTIYD